MSRIDLSNTQVSRRTGKLTVSDLRSIRTVSSLHIVVLQGDFRLQIAIQC